MSKRIQVSDHPVEKKPTHAGKRSLTSDRFERLVDHRFYDESRAGRMVVDESVDLLGLNELVALTEVNLEWRFQMVGHRHCRRFL